MLLKISQISHDSSNNLWWVFESLVRITTLISQVDSKIQTNVSCLLKIITNLNHTNNQKVLDRGFAHAVYALGCLLLDDEVFSDHRNL